MELEAMAAKWYKKVSADFPAPRNFCQQRKEILIKMRDKVKLNTRLFIPDKEGPYDVLLTRNPYPANEVLYESLYLPLVEQGFCVIIQDCRGTGRSEGVWQPFVNERNDGIDTLNWLNEQAWVKRLATFGRFYSAFTQWITGDVLPSKVKTMILEVYGVNRFNQVYANGMFREDIYTSWAFANSGISSDCAPAIQYQKAVNYTPAEKRDQSILKQKMSFYQSYLHETDSKSEYWTKSVWDKLYHIPEKIKVPVLVTDGWADHHLEGSLLGFDKLNTQIKKQSRLLITPTDHLGELTGDIDYSETTRFGFLNMKANLDWLKHIFWGTDIFNSAFYVMRGTGWTKPQPATKDTLYYLAEHEKLVTRTKHDSQKVKFVYNPKTPLTWPGGNELLAWIVPGFTDRPHGFVKTKPYPVRKDVVKFESETWDKEKEISGELRVNLAVSTNKTDTAFTVRPCEKTEDDEYINIKDAISSLSFRNGHFKQAYEPNTRVSLKISLGTIVWRLKKGSRLVLLVSSSNFPMYAVHSNHEGEWSSQKIEANIASQTIYLGKDSYLKLPLSN